MEVSTIRQKLLAELPPIFTRSVAVKATGGLIAVGTLANLDSAGEGPPDKIRLGRKVAYERESFVEWFLARLEGTKGWKS